MMAMKVFTSWLKNIRGRKFGFTHDLIFHRDGQKYLERWVIWFGFGTLRLHRFWSSDDDRALHDHPWWFITFPLQSYYELVPNGRLLYRHRFVRRRRFHYRPATYQHSVQVPPGKEGHVWTIVLTGTRTRSWGFWPSPTEFVYWRDWS